MTPLPRRFAFDGSTWDASTEAIAWETWNEEHRGGIAGNRWGTVTKVDEGNEELMAAMRSGGGSLAMAVSIKLGTQEEGEEVTGSGVEVGRWRTHELREE